MHFLSFINIGISLCISRDQTVNPGEAKFEVDY